MKVALVHDSLIDFGGAERVLQTLLKIFPDADIYTSYYSSRILEKYFPTLSHQKIHASLLLQNRIILGHNTILQALAPLIWNSFNFEKYNFVFSSSSYILCNLISVKKPIHIQYIHTPPKNLFALAPQRPLQKIIPYTHFISGLYRKAIHSSPYIVTNSKYTQSIITNLFDISSTVIYPPVRVPKILPEKNKSEYFIIVSRIEESKSIDMAINAFNFLKWPLKIVGRAANKNYEKHLKALAGPSVDFLGMKSDEEIDALYKSAIASIFTAKNEDFGISPVESIAHGVPVVAFAGGGVKETIIDKKNGLLFYNHNIENLISALRKFSPKMFSPKKLYSYSKKYSEIRFQEQIKKFIALAMNSELYI